MEKNGHLEWKVTHSPGTLEAVGYKGGKKVLTDVVKTTGEAAALQMIAHKNTLSADGEDIAVITVEALDKTGRAVPTAGNEISFSIQGPGKIIGVGNGDPTSLENERFVETIQTVKIENLKEKEVSGMDASAETGVDVDDAAWKEAFKGRDYKNLAKAYLYRGSFTLPLNSNASELTLFYKNIGREQSLFINGKKIGENLKESQTGKGFTLEKSILKPGKNIIAIVATPIPKRYEWDNVNTDPGLIQIFTPAEKWKRKLFNGLAQVIVQTTGEGGEITLTAISSGVNAGVIKLKATAVKGRSAVE